MPFPKQPDLPTSPSNSSNDSIAQDIALNLAYFGVGFIPVIGSTVAVAELLGAMVNNIDLFGSEVDNVDKMIMAMGVLLPHVSKVPGVKNTLKAMMDYLKKGGVPAKNALLKIFKKGEGAIVKLFADSEKGASHGLNIFEDLGGEFLESAGEIVESAQRKFGSSIDEGLKSITEFIKDEAGSISFSGDLSEAIDKIKYPNLWSKGAHKNSVKNAFDHFKKHGAEFPEINNAVEFVEHAHSFIEKPPKGTLSKVRANGEKVFYDPKSETFAVRAKDGAPKTIFKPDPAKHGYRTNMDYYDAQ